MRKLLSTLAITILFTVTLTAQPDIAGDRDYRNFKRNFARAVAAGRKLDKCTSRYCVRNVEKYTGYANRFLAKLKTKYPGKSFAAEENQLAIISAKLDAINAIDVQLQASLETVRLWEFRLRLDGAGQNTLADHISEFNRGEVTRAVAAVLLVQSADEPTRLKAFVLKRLLRSYRTHVKEVKLLDETEGSVGRALAKSKEIQNKEDLIATLTPSLRLLKAISVVEDSALINDYISRVSALIANADKVAESNKPKLAKNYVDRLPTAAMINKELEGQFSAAIAAQGFEGITITGAILTDSDWRIEKTSNLSSFYRWTEGVVVMKHSAGECSFQYFNFRQPKTGGGWGQAKRQSSGARYYIDCAKVE